MDLFSINTNDLEEILIEANSLDAFFEKNETTHQSKIRLQNSSLGTYNLTTEKKGNIFFTDVNSFYTNNIAMQSCVNTESISLYFVKQGGSFFCKKNGEKVFLTNSSNNISFRQKGHKEKGGSKKECFEESIGLHLPIPYFENLVNQYPDLFSESFSRFQKGESFYLKEKFERTEPQIYQILSQIENSYLMGNCSTPYIDSKVLELLCLQFQSLTTQEEKKIIFKDSSNIDYEKIREAAFILLSDIHNPLPVRKLALKVGLNHNKLRAGFRELFGTTVYGYLFDYKMQLAEQLLLDSKKNITEIALQCGYNCPSHFSIAFKRKFGVSPSEKSKWNNN